MLDHAQMKDVASAFSQIGKQEVNYTPKGFNLPEPISKELAIISNSFKELQEARHAADYDVLKQFDPGDAITQVQKAEKIFKDWMTEKNSKNAPVFLAAMIFGKGWRK